MAAVYHQWWKTIKWRRCQPNGRWICNGKRRRTNVARSSEFDQILRRIESKWKHVDSLECSTTNKGISWLLDIIGRVSGKLQRETSLTGGNFVTENIRVNLNVSGANFRNFWFAPLRQLSSFFFCCLPVQVLLSLTLSIKVNDGIISALTLAATWTFVDGSCRSSCRCLHVSCQIGPKTISYLWAVKINEQ